MPGKKELIVFDANFFICCLAVKARDLTVNLKKAATDTGLEYLISDVVFDEIRAPATFKNKLKQIVDVVKIDQSEVEKIKDNLGSRGIRFPAQDPDLTLLVLSKQLLEENKNTTVHLVTDDFKLAKNSVMFMSKINVLSLSSFLLKLQRTVSKSQMRNYFKNLWQKSLNYTLSYMIERSKVYPAESKIQWLIERSISVTENSIISCDAELGTPAKGVRFEIGATKYSEELEIAEKYIENQNLPASQEELITDVVSFLENLKISREYIKRARDAIVKNESIDAVKLLKKGNGFLVSLLQVASGQLTVRKDYDLVQILICSEISKMEFLRAFILVSLGRVSNAIDSLDRAALFATIIHNYMTCLTLNYVKALILLFHGLYKSAIMQYNFTEELADIYNDERLKLKCGIGKAIAIYIQGEDRDMAMGIMEEIANMDLDENHLDAIIVFSELGDYFLALGHSQIAANLYNQALEISIDYKLDIKSETLIEKLKRAYISTVLEGYSAEDMVERLDVLLDKAYSVKDVEKYNEQIKKIASFNKLFYTPFEHIAGKKKIIPYSKLPTELKDDYLEVVYFEKQEEKSGQYMFIVSHYELGLLGLKLKTSQNITGIAENYSLKIKPSAKVKIYDPDASLKDEFLIRAIIEVTGKDECEIIHTLPSFFKQLNL
jgi:tetratricopeptide (TPR) repeat protein